MTTLRYVSVNVEAASCTVRGKKDRVKLSKQDNNYDNALWKPNLLSFYLLGPPENSGIFVVEKGTRR